MDSVFIERTERNSRKGVLYRDRATPGPRARGREKAQPWPWPGPRSHARLLRISFYVLPRGLA